MKKFTFRQIDPEQVDTEWYFLDDDGLYGQDNENGLVIGGNRRFQTLIYLQDEIRAKLEADYDLLNSSDEDIIDFLNEATGKRYDAYQITSNVQGEWQNVYYPIDEFSTQCLEEISDFYFGNVDQFICEEVGTVHIPHSRIRTDDSIKATIAEYCDLDVKQIKLLMFDGYKQTPKYREV